MEKLVEKALFFLRNEAKDRTTLRTELGLGVVVFDTLTGKLTRQGLVKAYSTEDGNVYYESIRLRRNPR